MEKDYYLKQAAAQQNCNAMGATTCAPTPTDPASIRQQNAALSMLVERLHAHRSCLRDIADFVMGPEPESGNAGRAQQAMPPIGGAVADMVATLQSAAGLLDDIDQQIRRLQRVSA